MIFMGELLVLGRVIISTLYTHGPDRSYFNQQIHGAGRCNLKFMCFQVVSCFMNHMTCIYLQFQYSISKLTKTCHNCQGFAFKSDQFLRVSQALNLPHIGRLFPEKKKTDATSRGEHGTQRKRAHTFYSYAQATPAEFERFCRRVETVEKLSVRFYSPCHWKKNLQTFPKMVARIRELMGMLTTCGWHEMTNARYLESRLPSR